MDGERHQAACPGTGSGGVAVVVTGMASSFFRPSRARWDRIFVSIVSGLLIVILNRFWACVAGGMSFARELEVESTSGRPIVDEDIDPAALLQLGLNARL